MIDPLDLDPALFLGDELGALVLARLADPAVEKQLHRRFLDFLETGTDAQIEEVAKASAGPFIGPKGGLWADPAHKVHWQATKDGDQGDWVGNDAKSVQAARERRAKAALRTWQVAERAYGKTKTRENWQRVWDALHHLGESLNLRAKGQREDSAELAARWLRVRGEKPSLQHSPAVRPLVDSQQGFLFASMTGPMRQRCDELMKAAAFTKYIKKEPTGNPARPWRYTYRPDPGKTAVRRGASFEVEHPERMFGAARTETYHVAEVKDGQARVTDRPDSASGAWMPAESVRHFRADLGGVVHGAPTGSVREIDEVLAGRGEFLGKGNDGLVFRVDDKVVKVSTTVPYQPMNQGHRSPQEAADLLLAQAEVSEHLRREGCPGILPIEVYRHADKAFQIRPYVHEPERWTPDQLREVAAAVEGMHARGYSLRDTVQAGTDVAGHAFLFDTGSAERLPEGEAGDHRLQDDVDHLRIWMRDRGAQYEPDDSNPRLARPSFYRLINPGMINLARAAAKRGDTRLADNMRTRIPKLLEALQGKSDEIDREILADDARDALERLNAA